VCNYPALILQKSILLYTLWHENNVFSYFLIFLQKMLQKFL